jgi:hypothetical protein
MRHNLLTLENVPPRTKVPKTLYLGSNETEGRMEFSIMGGWSEYFPEEVKQIMEACDKFLQSLIPWVCEKCEGDNFTTPVPVAPPWHGVVYKYVPHDWVRCRHCKAKTKVNELGIKR